VTANEALNTDLVLGRKRRNRCNTKVITMLAVHTDNQWLIAALQSTKHRWLMKAIMARVDSHTAPATLAPPRTPNTTWKRPDRYRFAPT
jgi:hypothetical protein